MDVWTSSWVPVNGTLAAASSNPGSRVTWSSFLVKVADSMVFILPACTWISVVYGESHPDQHIIPGRRAEVVILPNMVCSSKTHGTSESKLPTSYRAEVRFVKYAKVDKHTKFGAYWTTFILTIVCVRGSDRAAEPHPSLGSFFLFVWSQGQIWRLLVLMGSDSKMGQSNKVYNNILNNMNRIITLIIYLK